ncbi:hypothetical protein AAG570_005379 [Ranatra chinensis]|uniref:Dynein heavy chain linker domain-containing protein n=1 Tax=Ranatra chinensis TaxID=642074 RepID=A0ABD0Y1T7_9HEMI
MVILFQYFKRLLIQNVKELRTFQSVLKVIRDILDYNVEVEVIFRDIRNRFHIMQVWKLNVWARERVRFAELRAQWQQLRSAAHFRSCAIRPAKQLFSYASANLTHQFSSVCKEFADRYFSEGPSTVGEDLDRGLEMLEEYQSEFEELNRRKTEMLQAEQLFNLEVCDYSDFDRAYTDFINCGMVYKLYVEQKEARENWAKTLWANLVPQKLIDGIEGYLKEFRRLPKDVRAMPLAQSLEQAMKDFKNTVPLMVELKNEALRDRHWQELMDKTEGLSSLALSNKLMSEGLHDIQSQKDGKSHVPISVVDHMASLLVAQLWWSFSMVKRGVRGGLGGAVLSGCVLGGVPVASRRVCTPNPRAEFRNSPSRKHFDMSAERFTLQNMFSMELHKYEEMTQEIIAIAVKELSIEKGVEEVSQVRTTRGTDESSGWALVSSSNLAVEDGDWPKPNYYSLGSQRSVEKIHGPPFSEGGGEPPRATLPGIQPLHFFAVWSRSYTAGGYVLSDYHAIPRTRVRFPKRSVLVEARLASRPLGVSRQYTWKGMRVTVARHFKGTTDRGYILGPVEDILQSLDDYCMNLQSMAGSQFVGPFLGAVQKWEKTLSTVSEVLIEWVVLQRKWLYLEGIFVGGDIRGQLPEEAKKFDDIDRAFCKIMAETEAKPLVLDQCLVTGRLTEILGLSAGLERCQKSLNDYLSSKRDTFPRFYFLSDDELLSILGNMDPHSIQEHIVKVTTKELDF